jgi:predicted secreted Zn-dependent protease
MVLPQWDGYEQASAAAKKEWNRMIAKLREHEQRHVDIAIEEADSLASALIGEPMSKIASMVSAANAKMATRQQELDAKTEHGSKEGVEFGDVVLDTSIN